MKRMFVGMLGALMLLSGLPVQAERVTGLASTWAMVAKVATRDAVKGPVGLTTQHLGARLDPAFRLAKEAQDLWDKETPR